MRFNHRSTRVGRYGRAAAVISLTTVLAGCTGAPVAPTFPSETPTSAPTASGTAPRPGKLTVLEVDHSPGWMASVVWRPDVPVGDLVQLTEDQKHEFRTAQLAQFLANSRLAELVDVPEVELVRWIRWDEMGPVWGECGREQGVDVTYDPRGNGMTGPDFYSDGSDPDNPLSLVRYICEARFTIDPIYRQSPTRDQARVVYEYQTEVWTPCVRGLGYEPLDLPDQETYIQQFLSDDPVPTWPEGKEPTDDLFKISRACGDGISAAAYYGHS